MFLYVVGSKSESGFGSKFGVMSFNEQRAKYN